MFKGLYGVFLELHYFIVIRSFSTPYFVGLKKHQTAISAKSADTVKHYNGKNGVKNLESTLKSYVNQAINFKEDSSKKHNYTLTSSQIKHREIHLAIPQGTSPAKMQAIQNAIDYGKSKNVKIILTITTTK